MDDWDHNGPLVLANLRHLLRQIRDSAVSRESLNLGTIWAWHLATVSGLIVPQDAAVGVFRGEPGLEGCEVRIGRHRGTPSAKLVGELAGFEGKLKTVTARLDGHIAPDAFPNEDTLAAVVETCAWAHSEWVRIHPFANGNGRTARLLANALAMRYGHPPFVRLRPRPEDPYEGVADASMKGVWAPTVVLFFEMLDSALEP